MLDEGIVNFSKEPNSYTGEDLVEFHLHGNPILLKRFLNILFSLGARPAENGEFTKRAMLNGKFPISKAEAIGRLIGARSALELKLAQRNVFGVLTQLESKLRSDLISLKAECEAEIDFSSEDLTFESREERKERLHSVARLTKNVIASSERANRQIDQSVVVLFGSPNTGKSSLMNLILGKDRSIVSDIPGTTRDYIAEEILLEGIPIRIVDTAGIRNTGDTVEELGIKRSWEEWSKANIRILLLDAAEPWQRQFENFTNHTFDRTLIVYNKIDLGINSIELEELRKFLNQKSLSFFPLSCKTGEGIEDLLLEIQKSLQMSEVEEDMVLLEDRQLYHLRNIEKNLRNAIDLLDSETPAEIVVEEINSALTEVGKINGRVDQEEILGRIFSKFCVGK